ncbi:enoyl-CoA hydratase-related protein [Caenibius tardaugens]|nr:enoyl-CoA hydratase-related protein [Caenibius tardaugens]
MRLRLNRPERKNALATPVLQELASALAGADEAEDIRVALLVGSESVFAAGADIGELAASGPDDSVESPRFLAWQAIRAFSKPLVAGVEGWCLGAGAELMLCADIVVAARNARIGLPETGLGIMPGAGGTAILPRRTGLPRAMDMVLTGEPVTGETAWSIGLIARLADAGQAGQAALALAKTLSNRAPVALRAAKASLRLAGQLAEHEHLLHERRAFLRLLGTADKTEGISAFLEKRTPDWSGA